MIDIVSVGNDIGLFDTDTSRAQNILSIQLGELVYAPDLGIDLKYFLDPQFKFQNTSFKSYLIQTLANHSINVASVQDTIDNLSVNYDFSLTSSESDTTLIAR